VQSYFFVGAPEGAITVPYRTFLIRGGAGGLKNSAEVPYDTFLHGTKYTMCKKTTIPYSRVKVVAKRIFFLIYTD
jgi:hypothetical protein